VEGSARPVRRRESVLELVPHRDVDDVADAPFTVICVSVAVPGARRNTIGMTGSGGAVVTGDDPSMTPSGSGACGFVARATERVRLTRREPVADAVIVCTPAGADLGRNENSTYVAR
jgi:hypothetical protein